MQASGLHWMAIEKYCPGFSEQCVCVLCPKNLSDKEIWVLSTSSDHNSLKLWGVEVVLWFEKRPPAHLPDPICGIFLSMRRRWQCQSYSRTSPCWARQCEPWGTDGRTKAIQVFPGIAYHQLLCSSCSPAALSPEIFAFRTSSLAAVSCFWLE